MLVPPRRSLYSKKLGEMRAMAAAVNAGLQKMAEAKVDVNRMKVRSALPRMRHMTSSCKAISPAKLLLWTL